MLTYFLITAIANVILYLVGEHAPVGYEDDNGFHFVKEKQ